MLCYPFFFRVMLSKTLKKMMLLLVLLVPQVSSIPCDVSNHNEHGYTYTYSTNISRVTLTDILHCRTFQPYLTSVCGMFLCPCDQVERVQNEEAGSPKVRSYFCFSSRSSKAQEVKCKYMKMNTEHTHNAKFKRHKSPSSCTLPLLG